MSARLWRRGTRPCTSSRSPSSDGPGRSGGGLARPVRWWAAPLRRSAGPASDVPSQRNRYATRDWPGRRGCAYRRWPGRCGRSSMAEPQPSKLVMRVRFPSPAPTALLTVGLIARDADTMRRLAESDAELARGEEVSATGLRKTSCWRAAPSRPATRSAPGERRLRTPYHLGRGRG